MAKPALVKRRNREPYSLSRKFRTTNFFKEKFAKIMRADCSAVFGHAPEQRDAAHCAPASFVASRAMVFT